MRADASALTRKALETASRYLDVSDGEHILHDVRIIVTDRAVAAADSVLQSAQVDTSRQTRLALLLIIVWLLFFPLAWQVVPAETARYSPPAIEHDTSL